MCIHSNEGFRRMVDYYNRLNSRKPAESQIGIIRVTRKGTGEFVAAWSCKANNEDSVSATLQDLMSWHDLSPEHHTIDLSHVNEIRRGNGLSEVTEYSLAAPIIAPMASIDVDDGVADTDEDIVEEIDEYLDKQTMALAEVGSVSQGADFVVPEREGFLIAEVNVTYVPAFAA